MKALVETYIGNPSELGIAVIDMGSKDKGPHFVNLVGRFKLPFLVLLDKDAYAGNSRDTLRRICQAAGGALDGPLFQQLADLGRQACSNAGAAKTVRDAANAILGPAHVFTLGADMEMAVAASYSKQAMIAGLGPSGESHLSQQSCAELQGLTGHRYFRRLRELVGSKGWETTKATDNKPKPHVLPSVVRRKPGELRQGSDLNSLRETLRAFATT